MGQKESLGYPKMAILATAAMSKELFCRDRMKKVKYNLRSIK